MKFGKTDPKVFTMIRMNYERVRQLILFVAIALGFSSFVHAERPPAHQLLPEKTVVLLRIGDVNELVARFRETATGRMFQDEQMKPFVGKLYNNVLQAFEKVQENVGLTLDQLLTLPQGEMFFAVVSNLEGPPTFFFLMEVKEQSTTMRKLLDKITENLEREGSAKTTEMIGETKLTVLTGKNSAQPLVFFEKEGTVVFSSNVEASKKLHTLWSGKQEGEQPTLANNPKYVTVTNRCQGTRDEQPHLTFFVDPIELIRAATRDNFAAKAGLAILPTLGLDGLLAVGGSRRFIAGEFDSVTHFHVMLESPRTGVIKALALESGDSAPEPWVPRDISEYSTIHWNLDTTLREATRLMDGFQTEGAFSSMIRTRFSEPLGVDFEKEIIPAIESRASYVTRFEKPIRYNSQSRLIAVKLKDAKSFRPTLEKIVEKFSDRLEKQTYGGISYYLIKVPNPTSAPNAGADGEAMIRIPDPCVCILEDYFVATDCANLLRQCIAAKNDPEKSLAEAIDFKLIHSKIARQTGGAKPGFLSFGRPEDGMRFLYDLANEEGVRKNLEKRAQVNEAFKALHGALNDHPLPPFSVIEKYFAPGGGMVTNDETGFHYTGFVMRRK